MDKLINETDAEPLPGDGKRQVTQAIAVLGIIFPLYVKEYWPRLEDAVVDGLAGKGARLLANADEYTDRTSSGYSDNAGEVIYAVNCLDRPDITSVAVGKSEEAKFKAESPRFGSFLLWGSLPCANWPVKPTGKPHKITAAGSKPIVVVGDDAGPRHAVRLGGRAGRAAGERSTDLAGRGRSHRLPRGQRLCRQRGRDLPAEGHPAGRRHQVLVGALVRSVA